MTAEKPKSLKQIKAIYGLASRLGMDLELLHDTVFGLTRKTSIAALEVHEANLVIKTLIEHVNPAALNKPKGNITYLVTTRQVEEMRRLAGKMAWGDEQIDKLSQRQYKKPFRHLRVNQAQGLIEGMKSILERKGAISS